MEVLRRMLNSESYNTVSVMGLKGYGKTYGLAEMALAVTGKQVFILDTLGEITRKQLIKKNATYLKGSLNFRKVIEMINGLKSQYVIVDLSYFVPTELVGFADVFAAWALKRGNMAVFVDEIVDYCPQSGSPYSIGLQRLWRAGRNFRIFPVVAATQRPQEADKKILAHAQLYVILKLLHPLDRKKVEDIVTVDGMEWAALEKTIMSQQIREAVIFDGVQNKVFRFMFPDIKEVLNELQGQRMQEG